MAPGRPETNGVPPLADDRPYVDGTAVSAEELRAEVERLSNEDRQHVDDLREEVGDSLAELKARLDVKARVAERKDEAVAAVHQHVDRARHVAVDRAAVGEGHRRRETRPGRGHRGGPAGAARRRAAAAPAAVTPDGVSDARRSRVTRADGRRIGRSQ